MVHDNIVHNRTKHDTKELQLQDKLHLLEAKQTLAQDNKVAATDIEDRASRPHDNTVHTKHDTKELHLLKDAAPIHL
jgi:hypothetical protein